MASLEVLLPGEQILQDQLPRSKKGVLALGPGLRHTPPSTILSTAAGSLHVDTKKSAVWLESSHGRYLPAVGDLIIAQIHHSSQDLWYCSITSNTPHALLGHLSFESANKKSRPNLKSGDIVYARVCKAGKWEDTEIECLNSNTGKAEGMGQLKGGMVFSVTPAFARRLMMGTGKDGRSRGGVVILEEIGEKLKFEVAVGRNGKVWVDSGSVRTTAMIGRLLRAADEQSLDVNAQKQLAKQALKTA